MVASEEATETVWQVAMQQSKYWKSIHPKAVEPREGLNLLHESGTISMSLCRITSKHRFDPR